MIDTITIRRTMAKEADLHDELFARMKTAAEWNNEDAFLRAYREIDWAVESPERHTSAVRLALASGAYRAAQQLAAKGAERFPAHLPLRKMAKILAPPVVRHSARPADSGLLANRDWLGSHRDEYKGRWVALRDGELLGIAETADQLVGQVGEIRNQRILITQVY